MRLALAIALVACRTTTRATPDPVPEKRPVAPLHCPAPDENQLESAGSPPWERDPLGRWPRCLETRDGATVTIEKDPTDVDGWRVFLVVESPPGDGFRLATRAVSSMNLGPDGSIALAHTEDRVTKVSRGGTVLWSTDIPKCGAPSLVVGHDGSVINACGYSILKHDPSGKLLFQKWPFGNTHIGTPLILPTGEMIVSGNGQVALLDRDGEIRTKIGTGGNRYVHKLGVLPSGDIVFRTSMAAIHSDGPIHFYYEYEPPELFVVTTAMKVVSRAPAKPPWSGSRPFSVDLRGGRL